MNPSDYNLPKMDLSKYDRYLMSGIDSVKDDKLMSKMCGNLKVFISRVHTLFSQGKWVSNDRVIKSIEKKFSKLESQMGPLETEGKLGSDRAYKKGMGIDLPKIIEETKAILESFENAGIDLDHESLEKVQNHLSDLEEKIKNLKESRIKGHVPTSSKPEKAQPKSFTKATNFPKKQSQDLSLGGHRKKTTVPKAHVAEKPTILKEPQKQQPAELQNVPYEAANPPIEKKEMKSIPPKNMDKEKEIVKEQLQGGAIADPAVPQKNKLETIVSLVDPIDTSSNDWNIDIPTVAKVALPLLGALALGTFAYFRGGSEETTSALDGKNAGGIAGSTAGASLPFWQAHTATTYNKTPSLDTFETKPSIFKQLDLETKVQTLQMNKNTHLFDELCAQISPQELDKIYSMDNIGDILGPNAFYEMVQNVALNELVKEGQNSNFNTKMIFNKINTNEGFSNSPTTGGVINNEKLTNLIMKKAQEDPKLQHLLKGEFLITESSRGELNIFFLTEIQGVDSTISIIPLGEEFQLAQDVVNAVDFRMLSIDRHRVPSLDLLEAKPGAFKILSTQTKINTLQMLQNKGKDRLFSELSSLISPQELRELDENPENKIFIDYFGYDNYQRLKGSIAIDQLIKNQNSNLTREEIFTKINTNKGLINQRKPDGVINNEKLTNLIIEKAQENPILRQLLKEDFVIQYVAKFDDKDVGEYYIYFPTDIDYVDTLISSIPLGEEFQLPHGVFDTVNFQILSKSDNFWLLNADLSL